MDLIIVESPTKAKTISRFLEKDRYKVVSSYGHVRDLPSRELGVDVENNFKPRYEILAKAQERVKKIKQLAKQANNVILATDEDREGEAISWHLVSALDLEKLKKPYQRIAFHEITKKAIQAALKNPRNIRLSLVDAQQARRVLDRLVGYKLSPFLWKKIRKGLSAGRVQSVAVRLIVEREREIEKFKSEKYFEISAQLKKGRDVFTAKLWKKNNKVIKKLGIKSATEAKAIQRELESAVFTVQQITQREITKTPPPPFITSTLQQAAYNQFGFSAKQTMQIAQQLYEGVPLKNNRAVGLITYMRTDSIALSLESVVAAQKEITKLFGKEYALTAPRVYHTKAKSAQEAHEAIRPTRLDHHPENLKPYLDTKQFKLYSLIWKRTLATQMAAAKINATSIEIAVQSTSKSKSVYHLKTTGSVIKFDGYLKLLGNTTLKQENVLPLLKKNDLLDLVKIISQKKATQPPPRYSEATLVKALEERSIGRPSTYAPTISTIQERGYVEKNENKKLQPTEIGILVNDLLVEHFTKIVDYDFTAAMENNLDEIARSEKKWQTVIKGFYQPFVSNLKEKSKEVKKEDFQTKLGRRCPKCESELVEKFGRYGKFIACSNYPKCKYTEKSDEDKAKEAAIKKSESDQNGDIICDQCGAKMEIKNGPYGMFLGCSNYPQCKNIKKIENKVGVKCPQCQKGDIVEKQSRKGRIFYGCSNYPECKFALWQKPTGEKCPRCKSLLVFVNKNKVRCSNKECGFEKEEVV